MTTALSATSDLAPGLPRSADCGSSLCPDCGGPIAKSYCPDCGEHRYEPARLTTHHLVRQGLHEIFDVDSKTVQSFLTLFRRPGALTVDFLAGRTRRYLSPLRIYLTVFAVLLLATSLYVDRETETRRFVDKLQANPDTSFQHLMARAARRHHTTERAMMEQTQIKGQQYRTNPWLRIADPIIVGFVLSLLFRGRRRNYAEHLVFSLHLLAFNAATSIVISFFTTRFYDRKPVEIGMTLVQWLALGTYFFIAARVVHQESQTRTAVKSIGFVLGTQVAVLVVPMLAMICAMIQVMIR